MSAEDSALRLAESAAFRAEMISRFEQLDARIDALIEEVANRVADAIARRLMGVEQ